VSASSTLRGGGVALALLAVLNGCTHASTSPAGSSVAPSGSIGYVRMDELVQKHPLYEQLARYDRSIDAFDLHAEAPQLAASDPQLRAREAELQKELSSAADRTRKLINAKQQLYQAQENAAIAAALRGANLSGPSAAQIAAGVNATAGQQQNAAAQQTQRNVQAYQGTLQRQDQAQIAALQKTLSDRATRTYRAKADELQSKESALSLSLASQDAAQRLALRTKLSSLALDDAGREDAQKQLAALDSKESDAIAAQRNRDQQTLIALQTQLHDQEQAALDAQVAAIRAHSAGSLARQQQLVQAPGPPGPVVAAGPAAGAQGRPSLSPALRAKIQQLHDRYQKKFQDDAQTTVAQFNQVRTDLSRRYAELSGIDDAAQGGAQAQIVELRKKRDDLYVQIVNQIEGEVRVLAQQRGVSVVLSDIVAPAGGVDLTPDALKDIESLHE
jgi:hypothetical protein